MTTPNPEIPPSHHHAGCCASSNHNQQRPGMRWIFWGFMAVAAFYLWTEHRAHLFSALPFLFFLACPLMHLFHRHRHTSNTMPRERENNP